jgi:hypothetical protein
MVVVIVATAVVIVVAVGVMVVCLSGIVAAIAGAVGVAGFLAGVSKLAARAEVEVAWVALALELLVEPDLDVDEAVLAEARGEACSLGVLDVEIEQVEDGLGDGGA